MFTKKIYFLLLILCLFSQPALPQFTGIQKRPTPSSPAVNRERGLATLFNIKEALEANFYDKTYHGVNLAARFKVAEDRIKNLNENWQIYRVVAQLILDLDDSHTTFYPPERFKRVEYGFSLQMMGDVCYVVNVKKGSDAESKGLRVGDVVTRVGSFPPQRNNLWKINYLYYSVDPQDTLKLSLLGSDSSPREIEIKAAYMSEDEQKLEARKRRKEKLDDPYKCQAVNQGTIACKLRTFSIETDVIDKMMKATNGFQNMILDLRGNRGGYVKAEEHLTGYFFDKDVKIGDSVARGKVKERFARAQKNGQFKGNLVVLIDSDSASAAEVFAGIVQIEKRGTVVGDVSAGAVMTSQFHGLTTALPGRPNFEFSVFGLNLTVADLIMSDGKRLEKVGVIPDQPIVPTRKALVEGTDPVLAYSVGLLKVNITSEQAGRFYFITNKPEGEDKDVSEEDDK